MHIKLNPIVHEFNNCFQGQVETIVEEYYHKNYLLSQLYRWTTYYDIVDGKLVIKENRTLDNADELEMLGLEQVVIQCDDKKELLTRIKQELNRKEPLIIGIQIANCPWDPNYKSDFIMQHFIIVVGFDDSMNSLICCDATYNIRDGYISIDDFIKGGSFEYRKIVEIDGQKSLDSRDAERLFRYQAKRLLQGKDKHFQRLKRIATFLIDNAEIIHIKEENLDNILFSRTYMIIRDCAKTREMLTYILDNFYEKRQKILKILFNLSMKKWLRIRILYVRAASTDSAKADLINIGKRLFEIKELEENIARYIVSDDISYVSAYLGHSNSIERNPFFLQSKHMLKENVIDLSQYYNNKAFGIFCDEETAMFSELGEYMIKPSEDILLLLDDERRINISIPAGLDNVVCLNQVIPINLSGVVEIYVIGTAEYVSEDEYLLLIDDNRNEEKLYLDFPEWYTEILSNKVLVMSQRVVERKENKVIMTSFSGKIFLERFLVDTKKLAEIRFPEKGRIHIFQIVIYSQ